MPRRLHSMEPTDWRAPPDGDPVAQLSASLGAIAEVRAPGDAEEPILAPGPRAALIDWLGEIRAKTALAEVGLKPRSTALLYGPPGTGKTTFAHHIAARLGLPLVLVGAEHLNEKYVGEGEKNAARLFDNLAKGPECVVLLDEIDAIGAKRSGDDNGASRGANAMLTTILRKIESFDGLLFGATNRKQVLDPALWRRFHMQVSIDLPGDDERYAILARYAAPFSFAEDDLEALTLITHGASPSLLRQLMEGVKRTIVMAQHSGRQLPNAVDSFAAIAGSVAPPPEFDPPPPLWRSFQDVAAPVLAGFSWPPVRMA